MSKKILGLRKIIQQQSQVFVFGWELFAVIQALRIRNVAEEEITAGHLGRFFKKEPLRRVRRGQLGKKLI
jgi:hypothetical protein